MNMVGTSFKNHKNLLKFLIAFVILGILISFLLFNKFENKDIILSIKNIEEYLHNNHINYLLTHFTIVSIMITSSLTIIGTITFPIYLLYEIISINYNILIFIKAYHFAGLIYGILYNFLTKFVFLLLLIILFKKVINIIKVLFNSDEKITLYSLNKNIKIIICLIIAIIINDLLIYLFASKILEKLLFIIK